MAFIFKDGVFIIDLTIAMNWDAPPYIPLRGGARVGVRRCDWCALWALFCTYYENGYNR